MQTIAQRLVGTWRLVSYETQGADGSVAYPMGTQVTGLIMYAPDGFMSANLMIPGRQAFSGGSASSATPAELAAGAAGYFGYAGRFEVDEDSRIVTHYIEVALAPNLVGTAQRRHVLLDGRRLVLRGDPVRMAERIAAPVITWERVS
jgi:hypothetical protein